MTQKKDLVVVGASIAVGCQSCTVHHFKVVRQAGATEAEMRQENDFRTNRVFCDNLAS